MTFFRFFLSFQIGLCIYAEISAFPTNIDTNQISIDSDLVADLSSVEVGEVETVTQIEGAEVSSTTPTDVTTELKSQDKSKNGDEEKISTKQQPDDDKIEYEYRVIYLPVNSPELNRPNCDCSAAGPNPGPQILDMLSNFGQVLNGDSVVSSGMLPSIPQMPMLPSIPPQMFMPPQPSLPMQRSPTFIKMPQGPPMSINIPMPVPIVSQSMGLQFIPAGSPQVSVIQDDTPNDSSTTATTAN